jgi:Ca2+ transporting ATPase
VFFNKSFKRRTIQRANQYFKDDLPSTLAMSVLVVVEMVSAFTAVSDRQSILTMPPWKNLYLVAAVLGSFVVHILVLKLEIMREFSQLSIWT